MCWGVFLDYGYTITFLLTQIKLKKEIDLTKGGVSDASGNRLDCVFFSFSEQAIIKLISFDMSLISTQSLIYLYLPNDSYSISWFSVVFVELHFLLPSCFSGEAGGQFLGGSPWAPSLRFSPLPFHGGHCYCKKIQSEHN